MALDRLKEAFFALVRAGAPSLDYYGRYRARVVSQNSDTFKLDVQPDDSRLPPMSNLRLKLGIPGATATISPGAYVLVGWEGGDPSKPFAEMFEGGAHTIKLTLAQDTLVAIGDVRLGAESGGEPPSKATTLKSYLDRIANLLANHVHVGVTVGGGVTGTSPVLLSPALNVPDFAATKVEVT